MAKVKILFENERTLTIVCDKFTVERNNLTGEIINMSWEGLQNIKPMYIDFTKIFCIYQDLEAEE